jgi:hypothetical protein
MENTSGIFIGKNGRAQYLALGYANRHGLIAGATGTGKTVTLQVLSEGFSRAGVPVFMADVKGDLSGMSQPADMNAKLEDRARAVGLTDYAPQAFPVVFWDLFGRQGHALRATVSDMGPLLLSRLLQLNETQEGVLNIAFRLADDEGLLLLDFKDLRSLLTFVGDHSRELSTEYGTVRKVSVGAIQRRLLVLEQQGAEHFFGEPALELRDLMRTDRSGFGMIHILAADRLMQTPRLYSTFMLWLLSELFEELPEVGDMEKPRLVFFFDEAHLLFDDAPKALIDKVEQVARLIRSKGVGVYFISQSALDVPDDVLGQLGNRFQHALRAFTPRDQRTVKAVAQTFRANPDLDTETTITELGVGEALVSTLQDEGIPGMVERTLIRPPCSRIGPATETERRRVMAGSPVAGMYDGSQDRESAYEILKERTERAQAAAEEAAKAAAEGKEEPSWVSELLFGTRRRQGLVQTMAKSVARKVGRSIGRQILRGLLGSIFKGR